MVEWVCSVMRNSGTRPMAWVAALVVGAGHVDQEALGPQPGRDRGGDGRLVVHDQHPSLRHAATLGAARARIRDAV